MWTKKISQKKGGFSLVELLVAVAILAIGIAGLMKLNISNLYSLLKAQKVSQKISWAQSVMERIVGAPFDDVENECEAISESQELREEGFQVTCRVVEHSPDLKQVLVSVAGRRGKIYNFFIYRARGER